MTKPKRYSGVYGRRRGMATIFVILCIIAMFAFCSLAVDLGRVQTSKTELRRAVDAAARAGAAYLPQGSAAVTKAANGLAGVNKVDSVYLSSQDVQVVIGVWNLRSRTFSAGGKADNITTLSAVQVTGLRTKANNNDAIPLVFGSILGAPTCDVTATSVAALVSITAPVTQFVSAHGNPWLAGEPAGTLASIPDGGYASAAHPWKYDIAGNAGTYSSSGKPEFTDGSKVESTDYAKGEPYGTPAEFDLTVEPGSVIQISVPLNSENLSTNHGYYNGETAPSYFANGSDSGSYSSYKDDAASNSSAPGYTGIGNSDSASDATGSEHGMSNIDTPINSMVGVFLGTGVPDTGSIPPGLDFSTQTERDYTNLEPELKQTFYVGNGSTSGGTQQTIVVPPNATRLFLGTMDGHEWSNNQGGFNATITEFTIELVQ